MRKGWFALIVLCILGQFGISIYLDHHLTALKDMYTRDTQLAYEAGVTHGIEQAVDSSPDVEVLTILFSRYRYIDNPVFIAKCVARSSAKWGVSKITLAGIILQESSGNPDARSSCGAVGLTQIRWKIWGKTLQDAGIAQSEDDLFDPATSIESCAYILHLLEGRYGDKQKVLRHYSGNARGYTDKVIGRVTG